MSVINDDDDDDDDGEFRFQPEDKKTNRSNLYLILRL